MAPGKLVEAEGVDGTYPNFDNDPVLLWRMICTMGMERQGLGEQKGIAFARIQFKELTGLWPSGWSYRPYSGMVHAGVRALVDRQLARWKRKKNCEKKARRNDLSFKQDQCCLYSHHQHRPCGLPIR